MRLFVGELGYPLAWPIGRFWPQGRTSGVALGGLNLEFLQPDVDAPARPVVRTLVFEPTSLDDAVLHFESVGLRMELREKWESNPELLRLRGYSEEESLSRQLICRNLVPLDPVPVDFFLCEYSPFLRERLAFPEFTPVHEVVVEVPTSDFAKASRLLAMPADHEGARLVLTPADVDIARVTEVRSPFSSLSFQPLP